MTKFKKRKEEQDGVAAASSANGNKKAAASGSSVPERFCKIFKKNKKKKTYDSKKETSSLGGSSDEASTPPSPESHSDDYDNGNDLIFGKKVFKFKNSSSRESGEKRYSQLAARKQQTTIVHQKYKRKSYQPSKLTRPAQLNFFGDKSMWVEKQTCCGVVFECLLYEAVMVDVKRFAPCAMHTKKSVKVDEDEEKMIPLNKISKVSDLISASTPALKKHHLFVKRHQQEQQQLQSQQISCDNPVNGNNKTDSSYSPTKMEPIDPLALKSVEGSQISPNTITVSNENNFIKNPDKYLHKLNPESIKIVKTPLTVGNPVANNIKNIINFNGPEKTINLKTKIGNGIANIIKCAAGGNENSSDSGYEEIAQQNTAALANPLKVNVLPPNLMYATALVGLQNLSQAPVVASSTSSNSYSENVSFD
jgi:hypothetical protein